MSLDIEKNLLSREDIFVGKRVPTALLLMILGKKYWKRT